MRTRGLGKEHTMRVENRIERWIEQKTKGESITGRIEREPTTVIEAKLASIRNLRGKFHAPRGKPED
jgi:hypothetical protein